MNKFFENCLNTFLENLNTLSGKFIIPHDDDVRHIVLHEVVDIGTLTERKNLNNNIFKIKEFILEESEILIVIETKWNTTYKLLFESISDCNIFDTEEEALLFKECN